MKNKYKVQIAVLCIGVLFFAECASIFALTQKNEIQVNSSVTNSIDQTADRYDIDWGTPMEGITEALDIDAHPYDNILYIIDAGTTIRFFDLEESTTWEVFCEFPDYVDYPYRISVYLKEEYFSFLVIDRRGIVYEMTYFELGGYSVWKKHYMRAKDIAVAKGSIPYALSSDSKHIFQLISDTHWRKIYSFPNEAWWPFNDVNYGYPKRIDADDYLWILTSKGSIWSWNPNHDWKWTWRGKPFDKPVSDLAVWTYGSQENGYASVIALGGWGPSSKYGIYQRLIGAKYHGCSGSLRQITLDRHNKPWGINFYGEVFRGNPIGSLPELDVYLNVKLQRVKYYDNHERYKYSEQRVKYYYEGNRVGSSKINWVKDGQTVWYKKAFIKNEVVKLSWNERIYNFKIRIRCWEYDLDDSQYYKAFGIDSLFGVPLMVDTGYYEFIALDYPVIKYWVFFSLYTSPLRSRPETHGMIHRNYLRLT